MDASCGKVTNGAAVAPANASAKLPSGLRLIGLAGRAGGGKDTFYENVLKPRGFLRLQMTLHYKVWLTARGYYWQDVFYNKPPHIRKMLQEEITALRYGYGEEIWLDTLKAWMRALTEIVGVAPAGVAVIDLRFLIEMRGIKKMGGKILHLKACDEQTNVAPELHGHRSETELDSPDVLELQCAHPSSQGRPKGFQRIPSLSPTPSFSRTHPSLTPDQC